MPDTLVDTEERPDISPFRAHDLMRKTDINQLITKGNNYRHYWFCVVKDRMWPDGESLVDTKCKERLTWTDSFDLRSEEVSVSWGRNWAIPGREKSIVSSPGAGKILMCFRKGWPCAWTFPYRRWEHDCFRFKDNRSSTEVPPSLATVGHKRIKCSWVCLSGAKVKEPCSEPLFCTNISWL